MISNTNKYKHKKEISFICSQKEENNFAISDQSIATKLTPHSRTYLMWPSYTRWGLLGSEMLSLVRHSIRVFWNKNKWHMTHLGLDHFIENFPPDPLAPVFKMFLLEIWNEIATIIRKYFKANVFHKKGFDVYYCF